MSCPACKSEDFYKTVHEVCCDCGRVHDVDGDILSRLTAERDELVDASEWGQVHGGMLAEQGDQLGAGVATRRKPRM